MGEWIPPTRTTPGRYVADDDLAQGAWLVNALATKHSSVRAFVAHVGELEDAIADLQIAAGYVQAATERLTRELAELRARVDVQDEVIMYLQENLKKRLYIDLEVVDEINDMRARVAALEADAQADVSFVILEPVRDDALDAKCAAYERIPQSLDRSNTNQTHSWLPGDAWDQYCADVESHFVPPPTHGRCGPGDTTITWTTEPPPLYTPGYEAEG